MLRLTGEVDITAQFPGHHCTDSGSPSCSGQIIFIPWEETVTHLPSYFIL